MLAGNLKIGTEQETLFSFGGAVKTTTAPKIDLNPILDYGAPTSTGGSLQQHAIPIRLGEGWILNRPTIPTFMDGGEI